MSTTCGSPISWDTLVDYWASDLDAAETDRIDEHLVVCQVCSGVSARVATVREAVRTAIPPFLSRAQLEVLRARGLRIVENPVVAGERVTAVFGADVDILLHRLRGLDLVAVESERARVLVTVEETGEILLDEPRVPLDRESGEILVACQRHFGTLPPNIVFEVRVPDPSGAEKVARYAIPHVFERHV